MTYLCTYFFIFVASLDPLSKNKSRIIIQKCRNFCKQLTLPGRTVQQLPFFKTVWLYTVKLTLCTYNYNILLLLITYVLRRHQYLFILYRISVSQMTTLCSICRSHKIIVKSFLDKFWHILHQDIRNCLYFVCLFAHYVYMSCFYLYIIFPCF